MAKKLNPEIIEIVGEGLEAGLSPEACAGLPGVNVTARCIRLWLERGSELVQQQNLEPLEAQLFLRSSHSNAKLQKRLMNAILREVDRDSSQSWRAAATYAKMRFGEFQPKIGRPPAQILINNGVMTPELLAGASPEWRAEFVRQARMQQGLPPNPYSRQMALPPAKTLEERNAMVSDWMQQDAQDAAREEWLDRNFSLDDL